jgi:uncharacterized protein HemY
MSDHPAACLHQHNGQVQGDGQAVARVIRRRVDVPVVAVIMVIMTMVVVTALAMGVIVAVIVRMGRHANSGAYWRRSDKIRHAGRSRQQAAGAPPAIASERPVSPSRLPAPGIRDKRQP